MQENKEGGQNIAIKLYLENTLQKYEQYDRIDSIVYGVHCNICIAKTKYI